MNSIIEIKNLSRSFQKKDALIDITISMPQGVVLGLVGENGAGKTTLIKHILGVLRAKSGSVSVFGYDPVRNPVEVLGRIGYLSEEREMPDWMTIDELVKYSKAFYPAWDDKYCDELIQMFELNRLQTISTLSRGQRAKAGLLIALVHKPALLLLDEPSSGLDPIVRGDILGAIIRTVADEGRSVLFSSHLLDEVERVADNVAMIHEGKLIINDTLDNIKMRYKNVALRLKNPQENKPVFPGAVFCKGSGRDWNVICNGKYDEFIKAVQSSGAEIVEEIIPTLEEIFISHAKA